MLTWVQMHTPKEQMFTFGGVNHTAFCEAAENFKHMKNIILLFTLLFLSLYWASPVFAQDTIITVPSFNKVRISPKIKATLRAGSEEKIIIKNSDIPIDEINIVNAGNRLHIYLDGHKVTTKNHKVKTNGWKMKVPIYKTAPVDLVIVYKELEKLTIRGDEKIYIANTHQSDYLKLALYGDADVMINDLDLQKLKTVMYGDSDLTINNAQVVQNKTVIYGDGEVYVRDGAITEQYYLMYGDTKLRLSGANNEVARFRTYGESDITTNTSEKIKLTSLGEQDVTYYGTAKVKKGIMIGENSNRKMGTKSETY